MRFLIDEGNFNTTFENSSDHLIDQPNAAKSIQIISVHNLPRINLIQPSMKSVSVIKRNTVHQHEIVPVESYTPSLPSDQEEYSFSDQSVESEQSSSSYDSMETIAFDDLKTLAMNFNANALQDSDQQVIPDANIEQNFVVYEQFHDSGDESSEEQEFLDINDWLMTDEEETIDRSEENSPEYVENVGDQSQQKRKNISAENSPNKKRKLTEDATIAKEFECDICEYQTNCKLDLKTHTREHMVRPYYICRELFVEKN